MNGTYESRVLTLEDSLQRSLLTQRTLTIQQPHTTLKPEQVLDLQIKTLVGDLEGHEGPIKTLAMTGDGGLIISGSTDKSIIIWSTLDKKPVFILKGHTDEVTDLVLSPDSSLLLSCSLDKTCKLWNFKSKSLILTLNHTEKVNSAALSQKSSIIFTCTENSCNVWSFHGTLLKQLKTGINFFNCFVLNKFFVAGCETGADLWTLEGFGFDRKLDLDGLASITANQDLSFFAAGQSNGKITVWDANEVVKVFEIIDRKHLVAIRFSGNSRYLVSCSDDYYIYIWDLEKRFREVSLRYFPKKPNAFCVSFDCGVVVAGFNDKSLRVWESCERKDESTFYLHSDEVRGLALTPDNKFLISCSSDSSLKIQSRDSNLEDFSISSSARSPATSLTSFNRCLLVGHEDGSITIWDMLIQRPIKSLQDHSSQITSLATHHASALLASASQDSQIIFWDLAKTRKLFSLPQSSFPPNCLIFSQTRQSLYSGDQDHNIRVWDLSQQKQEKVLSGHPSQVVSLALLSDARLASASRDGAVFLWDSESFAVIYRLYLAQQVKKLAVWGREELLFAVGQDKVFCLDLKASCAKVEFNAEGQGIESALVDGDALYGGLDDGRLFRWDLKEKRCEWSSGRMSGRINDLALTAGVLVACSGCGLADVWELEGLRRA